MPAPITVIIPTLNSAATLGPTLSCLFQGVEAGLIHQLIFADGGSNDEIEHISKDIGAKLITSPQGRGTQLAAGAKAAKTEWMLFLHADTTLSPDWLNAARRHIETTDNAAYFRLRFDNNTLPAKITAGWANLRSAVWHLPYGDQGLLIPAALYHAVGGYPDIPLMEDVAIARTLRKKLRQLPATATTSAAKYVEQGWLKRGSRNLLTLSRYFCGTAPEILANSYRKP